MFFAGETLNIITILALVIAVGMLVDNSIVVAENIQRMHKEGLSRRDACVKGAGEIALAITMATLTTIVVFVPVSLVEGEGQFFLMRLSLPISVSLLASLLVALVFIPLSVYLTLPANEARKQPAVLRRSHEKMNAVMRRFYELTFERLNHLYCRALEFFLQSATGPRARLVGCLCGDLFHRLQEGRDRRAPGGGSDQLSHRRRIRRRILVRGRRRVLRRGGKTSGTEEGRIRAQGLFRLLPPSIWAAGRLV